MSARVDVGSGDDPQQVDGTVAQASRCLEDHRVADGDLGQAQARPIPLVLFVRNSKENARTDRADEFCFK